MEDRAHLKQMAQIVLSVPGLTPADYWELSHDETLALADELAERNKRQSR